MFSSSSISIYRDLSSASYIFSLLSPVVPRDGDYCGLENKYLILPLRGIY